MFAGSACCCIVADENAVPYVGLIGISSCSGSREYYIAVLNAYLSYRHVILCPDFYTVLVVAFYCATINQDFTLSQKYASGHVTLFRSGVNSEAIIICVTVAIAEVAIFASFKPNSCASQR